MIIGDITGDINEGDISVKDFADKGLFPKRHDIGDISVVTPERLDLRPERSDLRPEAPDEGGGTNERTNERTKVPCVLQDIVPFGAAAQKGLP